MITLTLLAWLNTGFNLFFNMLHVPQVPAFLNNFLDEFYAYVTTCTQYISWLFPNQSIFNSYLNFQLDCITCVITYKFITFSLNIYHKVKG